MRELNIEEKFLKKFKALHRVLFEFLPALFEDNGLLTTGTSQGSVGSTWGSVRVT